MWERVDWKRGARTYGSAIGKVRPVEEEVIAEGNVPSVGPSKVSYHVMKLEDAGLVREDGRGRWAFYALDRKAAGAPLDEVAGRPLLASDERGAGGGC